MALWGNRQAFERSVLEHLPAVMALAIRLTGNIHAAEDLTQEALLRASRSWRQFRGQASSKSWLFRIAINVFRDQAGRPTLAALPEEIGDDREAEVVEQASAAELQEAIARLVSALPPRQREVLVLSAYENMPPAEIAELLEISVDNVYANLHAARARLKSQLAPYFAER